MYYIQHLPLDDNYDATIIVRMVGVWEVDFSTKIRAYTESNNNVELKYDKILLKEIVLMTN